MGDVRAAVQGWFADYHLERLSDADLLRLSDRLMAQAHTEDKLAVALLLQEVLLPAGRLPWPDVLARTGTWFEKGYLADWNAVDWYSVKALWALVGRDGPDCARAIVDWHRAEGLWQARASMVTFANVASRGDALFPGFVAGMLQAGDVLIARPERFSKTAVGWVLRGVREAAPEAVDAFVEAHLAQFSTEALRSVFKNLDKGRLRSWVDRHRAVLVSSD